MWEQLSVHMNSTDIPMEQPSQSCRDLNGKDMQHSAGRCINETTFGIQRMCFTYCMHSMSSFTYINHISQ